MWVRDASKPTRYGDITFRSALEAKVAEQLDALCVKWHYELESHKAVAWFAGSYQPDPKPVPGYLPDFTIEDASEDLELPLWVEVKPAELLYAVRDHLGCPERFDNDVEHPISGAELYRANLTEIWKPKRLAEIYGRDVLVVHQINRNRTLSILMRTDGLVLSRRHPAVNFRQVVADADRVEREARRRAEQEAAAAEYQKKRAAQVAEWVEHVRENGRPARFAGRCLACGVTRVAAELLIARCSDGGWGALCASHLPQEALRRAVWRE